MEVYTLSSYDKQTANFLPVDLIVIELLEGTSPYDRSATAQMLAGQL